MEQVNGILLKISLCGTLLFTCVFSPAARSDECAKPVTPIEKGISSPCTGYLFSPAAESDAWKTKQLSELQVQQNAILERRLNLYIQQSDVLAKQVASRDNTESFYRIAYFVVGAALTGYIAVNVNR